MDIGINILFLKKTTKTPLSENKENAILELSYMTNVFSL